MKKIILIIIVAILFIICCYQIGWAQEQPTSIEIARRYYETFQYDKAADVLLKKQSKSPNNFKLADKLLLAESFRNINKYQDAEKIYQEIYTDASLKKSVIIDYANLLKVNQDYDKAKTIYQYYIEKGGDANEVKNLIIGCDSAKVWMNKSTNHKVRNENLLNSNRSEFAAFQVKKDKVFYTAEPEIKRGILVDGRTGKAFLREFTAKINTDKTLSNPDQNVLYRDYKYHFGLVESNKDSTQLFVTKTYVNKKGRKKSKEGERIYLTSNLEVYEYRMENGTFKGYPFPYNNVKSYSVGHTAFCESSKILYFASDMPGGYGGTDIWFSVQNQDKSWGKPVNAGSIINSKGNEMFPTVNSDGYLYFSSNGLIGMGGLDVFKAKGSKSDWGTPKNLGYPLNSGADDFYFKEYEDTEYSYGYISSNRFGGMGGDDIYSFTNANIKSDILLKGIVYNKKTGEIIEGANIGILENNIPFNNLKSLQNGTFSISVNRDKTYFLESTKEFYTKDNKEVITNNSQDTIYVKLYLEPNMVKGKTYKLENIHYDFDKDNIRQDASIILNRLVAVLEENPTMEIELGSHTDSRGSDIYNIDLAQRRAKSAVNYLIGKGISKNRIVAHGYGETQLLNHCGNGVNCSRALHQENRRTEVKVLKE